MNAVRWIACGILLEILMGCGCGQFKVSSEDGPVPDFKIAEIINTSTAKQRSFTVKISLPAHYSEKSVRSTLPTISNTLNEPASEITMLFYTPSANLHGQYDVARVVWKDNSLDRIEYMPPSAIHRR